MPACASRASDEKSAVEAGTGAAIERPQGTTAGTQRLAPDTKDRIRFAATAFVVLGIDQLTKSVVAAKIAQGESVSVLDDVLVIDHVRNTGAAFGLFRGFGGVLALAALAGLVIFGVVVLRRPYKAAGLAAGLVAGGAIGNLTDRVFRGSVVDFIDFRYWPAFNAADTAISVGAILLLIFGIGERNAPDRSD